MKSYSPKKKKPSNDCFNYALMLLSRRDYSEFELRKKLESYDGVEVENTINKLKEKGLLSDERYVERLVDRYIKKGYGFVKIEEELNKKGLLNVSSKAFLKDIYSEELEKENILKFLDKKPKEKLYSYLIQKGFRPHIVQEVLASKY